MKANTIALAVIVVQRVKRVHLSSLKRGADATFAYCDIVTKGTHVGKTLHVLRTNAHTSILCPFPEAEGEVSWNVPIYVFNENIG